LDDLAKVGRVHVVAEAVKSPLNTLVAVPMNSLQELVQ